MSFYTKKQLKKMKELVSPFNASELSELLGEALGPEELTNLSSELRRLSDYLNNKDLADEYNTELARVRAEVRGFADSLKKEAADQ